MPAHRFIHIAGQDAAEFLHAQLTTDVRAMQPGDHCLSAWCDASGRVITVLQLYREAAAFLAKLPADLADSLVNRLRMFVLRASVNINWLDDWSSFNASTPPPADMPASEHDAVLIFKGPGGRGLEAWGPSAAVASFMASQGNSLLDAGVARILAGVPWLSETTSGLYQPQMLNLHCLNALDFEKGCYPGQEVVARLQYRGRLKRQLYRLECQQLPRLDAGSSLETASGKRVGRVIESATTGAANNQPAWVATAVVDIDSAGSDNLGPEGTLIDILPYDYSVII